MKSALLFCVVAVFIFSLDSCKKQSPTTASGVDSLNINYLALIDSLNTAWRIMITEDDEKHMLMKRLLLEVSYTNNFDKARFEELNKQVDALNAMRYDQKSMRSSNLIDSYDSATWAVADNVILFARNHPRFQDIPIMEELINDINEKNNFVLIRRIHYDNFAKELNTFLDENGELLRTVTPQIDLEPMPLFELPS